MIDRDVEIKVGDQTYFLKPTLDAMRKINRQFESLRSAVDRVRALDFDAVCAVINAGAGHTPKQAQKLEQEVFEHGVVKAAADVIPFLFVLMNPNGDEEEAEGESGKG